MNKSLKALKFTLIICQLNSMIIIKQIILKNLTNIQLSKSISQLLGSL